MSQQANKKFLIELLKKVSQEIESNEKVISSEDSIVYEDKNNNKEKLLELLEKRKKENNKLKKLNKKYKDKYDNITKFTNNVNVSPIEELNNLNIRINALRENNSFLNKEIISIKRKKILDNIKSLNPKYTITDEKNFYNKYLILTKEKIKQKNLLKNNKKLINEEIKKFQDLMQIINDQKGKIKNSDLNKEINILKEDLSGDEEKIYNKIISDKSIILSNYFKNNMKLNN